jgi:PST family polysaccharide transporter
MPFGIEGVAGANSAMLVAWMVPHVMWSLHRTPVSAKELFLATSKPLGSSVFACAVAWLVLNEATTFPEPVLRLLLAGAVMMLTYLFLMLVVLGQYEFYKSLVASLLLKRSEVPQMSPQ